MPAITSENAGAWQQLANDCAKDRPAVGRRVRVVKGRKHNGKAGRVVRHQRSRFDRSERYASEASMHLRDMMGTIGFVCLVQEERDDDDGGRYDHGDPFWVDAMYLEVAP